MLKSMVLLLTRVYNYTVAIVMEKKLELQYFYVFFFLYFLLSDNNYFLFQCFQKFI